MGNDDVLATSGFAVKLKSGRGFADSTEGFSDFVGARFPDDTLDGLNPAKPEKIPVALGV